MFWQNYLPVPIIFSLGPLSIHWYGLIMVVAILVGFFYSWLAKNKPILKAEQLDSLFFYLVIVGLIGARLGHVFFFNWQYFSQNLFDIFKIWQGGLSILGTIIAELVFLFFWSKKNSFNFWSITDWLAPGLILGQAIGRWGNYFNQELYGLPTTSWWAIPIDPANRVVNYEKYNYFHPTFFYESILNFILFLGLYWLIKKNKTKTGVVTLIYLGGYSLIRGGLEFIRIDSAPMIWGLRSPQVYSLVVLLVIIFIVYFRYRPLPSLKK